LVRSLGQRHRCSGAEGTLAHHQPFFTVQPIPFLVIKHDARAEQESKTPISEPAELRRPSTQSVALSTIDSASSFFSFLFWSSMAFNLRASETCKPTNLERHL